MSKDFHSNNHSIQVGVPGTGVDGNLEIKTEGNIDITIEEDLTIFSTGITEIFGAQELQLRSDENVVISSDGGNIVLTSSDGMNITIDDHVRLDEALVEGPVIIDTDRSSGSLFRITNNGETQTDFTVAGGGGFYYLTGSLPLRGNKFIFAGHNKSLFHDSFTIGSDSNGETCLILNTTFGATSFIPINIPYKCFPTSFYIAGESTDGSGEFDLTIDAIRINKTTGVVTTMATNTTNYPNSTGDFLYEESILSDPEYRRVDDPTYDWEWSVKIANTGQNSGTFKLRWIKYEWA